MNKIINDNTRLFLKGNIPEEYTMSYYMEINPNIKAVVKPINKEEVAKVVKYCYDNDLTFLVRGSGTGAAGSQFTTKDDIVIIDLTLMDKIINFDEETLTLTVEPGVHLGSVQEFVENKPYFYPPDPGAKNSTIGGNVSTNAGGMRAVKYGTTRDYVKSIEVVLPTGEVATFGSLNVKDASGYDLKDLIIGSEGTLAVITEIKLKVIPRPAFEKSIVLAFDETLDATNTVLNILNGGFNPSALELFERGTIKYSEDFLKQKFPSQKGNAYVLATFDNNNEESLNDTVNKVISLFENKTAEIVSLDTKELDRLAWSLRDNILYALMEFTQYEMLDEVVPINKFAEMIAYTNELGIKYNTTILNFGHAGDGNIHTLLLKNDKTDEEWPSIRKNILDDLYNKVFELGGLISAEHGIGYTKRDYFLKHTDPIKIQVMRAIKKALDPKGLLNPGKVI